MGASWQACHPWVLRSRPSRSHPGESPLVGGIDQASVRRASKVVRVVARLTDISDRRVDLSGQVSSGQFVGIVLSGAPVELRAGHPVFSGDEIESLRRVVGEADRCLHHHTV